jgi:hypothetical protein
MNRLIFRANLFCILAAVLVCGCKRRLQIIPPEKTTVAITGAFGWTLGEQLPPQFEMSDYQTFFDFTNKNLEPFFSVEVNCLKDRTIYEIELSGHRAKLSGVQDALESKYGRGGLGYTTNGQYEAWTNGDCELKFVESQSFIKVNYQNKVLSQKRADEFIDRIRNTNTNLLHKL